MNQLVTIEELNVLKHLVTLGALEDLIVMNLGGNIRIVNWC